MQVKPAASCPALHGRGKLLCSLISMGAFPILEKGYCMSPLYPLSSKLKTLSTLIHSLYSLHPTPFIIHVTGLSRLSLFFSTETKPAHSTLADAWPVSSANLIRKLFILVTISLIKRLTSTGPSVDPCETPCETSCQLDIDPLKLDLSLWLCHQLCVHPFKNSVSPTRLHLIRTLSHGTVLKAFTSKNSMPLHPPD